MAKVLLDPITRIEGHLSIEIDVQNGKVVDARSRGDMFRGLESILRGRNPVDANQITQRICGVCPVSHGLASCRSLDDAFKITPNRNGRILRNLIQAANYLQSHILHFYHLAALDYVDITAILQYKGSDAGLVKIRDWAKNELSVKNERADGLTSVGPFLPRYEGPDFYIKDVGTNIDAIAGYVKALDIRFKSHQMITLFGGRMPHAITLVPGGVTQVPTSDRIRQFRSMLEDVEDFVNTTFASHVVAVAKAFPEYFTMGTYGNFMSYGVFDRDETKKNFMFEPGVLVNGKLSRFESSNITEQVRYARYGSGSNLHPNKGQTVPQPEKAGAYTWLKAPRYDGKPMEVGPLARIAVAYMSGNASVKGAVDGLLKSLELKLPDVFSVLGRYASRLIECQLLCRDMYSWLDELEAGGTPRTPYEIPDTGEGEGLWEAPRGALGHWIVIRDKKIANYQAVVPTTWYCGPRDDRGVLGPVEQMLMGTPISDPANPIEAARVVRSTDPCIACAVHVVEGDRDIATFRIC